MIFNNINKLSIVDDFVAKYGDIIIKKYPHFEDLCILFFIDAQLEDPYKALDICKDSPYMSNPSCKLIIKHKEAFNKCGFLAEEEMAIIGHELGHINASVLNQLPQDSLQKENQADDFSVFLGLGNEMKSALQKIIKADICPDKKNNMQKRIDRINEMQHPSQTT